MKLKHLLTNLLVAASLLTATEIATASVTSTITASGIVGSQQGRLSRNGILQTWSQDEPFPGIINPSVRYFYTLFAVNVTSLNYLDINFDSTSANTFLSVYQTSYRPNSDATVNLGFQTNWLGDTGTSGNYFGTDPLFVDVVAALNSTVYLVVANTAAGGVGLNDPFTLLVTGFPDSSFNSAGVELAISRVPEPSTLLLLAPLGLVAGRKLRARRNARGALAAA